jgi:dimethylglycine dehydrogenase
MMRVNYEGELGWELYHPICYNLHLYDELMKAGADHGMKLFGNRAVESLRLEKSYRAMYRDMNVEHTALESGLDKFVKFKKDDFVGKAPLLEQREHGLTKKMVTLSVDTIDADAYMNEAIYKDGKLVGRITSGASSQRFGKCLSMAYLDIDHATLGTELEVAVLERRLPARVIEDSPYDPTNERMKV